jgi:hypothetical protein
MVTILGEVLVGLMILGGAAFSFYEVKRSKPRALAFLGIGVPSLAIVVPTGTNGKVHVPEDADKQAIWRPRLHRTEHETFESTWFSPELKHEDDIA